MATDLLDWFDELFEQTCKKFDIEHLRAIRQQQPLRSEVVSSQQDTKKQDPQEAVPMKFSKEAAKKPVSKQKSLVPEAKKNPQMKREMSITERDQLGLVLQDLGGEYLDEILQIVAKRNSNMPTPEDGEIELDVDAIDSETMWELHIFLRLKLEAKQKNKAT
ncbi:hypothetical protein AG4045_003934 [Apium graveolens]|uniref:NET domain-containing protein n=1 Tax=Apium graveolens TaxID=4045 RepID=A0A6L5BBV2_APIGR|nr:hypothetical protein AG4045_003934 [Apium graveolens]